MKKKLLPEFVPGIMLSRSFYEDLVRPLVNFPHAAALLGEGSEVLGFDQPISADHAWGPRLQVFVDARNVKEAKVAVEKGLPLQFRGWPVKFFSWQTKNIRHHIEITTLGDWVRSQIGIDPTAGEISTSEWLALPQQLLLQITAGEVFHDDSGEVHRLRDMLSWYPKDIWLWAMASQWHLIGNAEPRVGRSIEAGDIRGSILIAAKIVRLLMELSFLQERRYWPYEKWFGTAFKRLAIAPEIGPCLDAILTAADEGTRIKAIHDALLLMARRHNSLKLTSHIEPTIDHFQVGINDAVRPYQVINADKFVGACKLAISDSALQQLVTVGIFDQLTHGDDALVNFSTWPLQIAEVYKHQLKASLR